MFEKKKTMVLKQSATTITFTETTTFGFVEKSHRKKGGKSGQNVKEKGAGWVSHELTEARNTIIEATFNKFWHTTIWGSISALIPLYLPYLLILFPGLPPVVAMGSAVFVSYILAALLLSYLRRLVVWGAGKFKNLFRKK